MCMCLVSVCGWCLWLLPSQSIKVKNYNCIYQYIFFVIARVVWGVTRVKTLKKLSKNI